MRKDHVIKPKCQKKNQTLEYTLYRMQDYIELRIDAIFFSENESRFVTAIKTPPSI